MKKLNEILSDAQKQISTHLNHVDNLIGTTHPEFEKALTSIVKRAMIDAATCKQDFSLMTRYAEEKLEQEFDFSNDSEAIKIIEKTEQMGFEKLAEKMRKQMA
jgi:hypothetical protein